MNIYRCLVLLAVIAVAAVSFAALSKYPGQGGVYVAFTFAANALLFLGFRKKAIFFDSFVGTFFWLGFWLKFSLRLVLSAGEFREAVGAFDSSPEAYDRALMVSTCGLIAFLVASLVRQRVFSHPEQASSIDYSGLFLFYREHRGPIVAVFLAVVFLFSFSNAWLGIYQRGMVTQTILPFGLNGVYKWVLQFGFASLSALIIRFEIEIARGLTWTSLFAPVVESFFSNTSLLSRGMLLNTFGMVIGARQTLLCSGCKVNFRRVVTAGAVFLMLFAVSVFSVNFLRAKTLASAQTVSTAAVAQGMVVPLFIDRWVGIEGVMAVSSYPNLGWDLWREAWAERYVEGELSLYDKQFIATPYTHPDIDKSINHFVSLPGAIAFFFYPGSYSFMFIAILLCGLFGGVFEYLVYRFSDGNLILCSLFAQVLAFRYASFGYVPAQSYLLIGTAIANVLLIAGANWLLRQRFRH